MKTETLRNAAHSAFQQYLEDRQMQHHAEMMRLAVVFQKRFKAVTGFDIGETSVPQAVYDGLEFRITKDDGDYILQVLTYDEECEHRWQSFESLSRLGEIIQIHDEQVEYIERNKIEAAR